MEIKRIKTIGYKKLIENSTTPYCKKCLSKNVYDKICVDCKNNGETLYFYERVQEKKIHTLKMNFELSSKQKEASLFFLDHFKNKKDAFLNAVCGSGKTEIMYEVLLYCLNENKKPIIVIPRKEIVSELYNRLISVFPNTTIKYLDGTHHDTNADLLLSTVNQLVNFEKEFDLLILDEADAFPYSGSEYLHRILRKSIKDDGVFFEMSATIKENINKDIFTMNRRYHKVDLSMPVFLKTKGPVLAKTKEFQDILNNMDRKFIIYVSSINKAKNLSSLLNIDYVSSKTLNASDIINKFKINNTHALISTTILERGITIPNLDVIIYDADNEVFTHQTIIQICGRVGRSFEDSKGNIYIFYRKNSLKFMLVERYINKMNHEM